MRSAPVIMPLVVVVAIGASVALWWLRAMRKFYLGWE